MATNVKKIRMLTKGRDVSAIMNDHYDCEKYNVCEK